MKTGCLMLVLCLLPVLLSGCGRDESATPTGVGKSDAPSAAAGAAPVEPRGIMQVVESRWEDKTETLSKTDLGKELRDKRVLSKVVNALSDEEPSELLDYMKAKRLDELTPFEAGALGMLARKLGKSGDRERLVSLLSNNCPREVGPVTIEYDLAVDERMKKMPDAFVALVEAYRVAQNAQAKATLLTALSDALPSLRASIPNDDAFVSACAEWHRKNRGRFKLSENTSSRGRITVSRPSRSRCLLWSEGASPIR